MKKVLLSLSVILCTLVPAIAQRQADSLKLLLAKESQVADRVNLLFRICDIYRISQPDSSLKYARQALQLLSNTEDDRVPRAELYIVSYYYVMGKPDTALSIAEKNIRLLESKPGQQALLAQYYSTAGLSLMKKDEKKKALDRFYQALNMAEKAADYMTVLKAYVNIGWVMMELNQFEQAIVNFHKGIALTEEKNLPTVFSSVIYNNLASSYGSLNKTDSAFKYARIAIDMAKAQNDVVAQANGLFILGTSQQKMGKLNDALASFLAAQPLREQVGDPYFIVSDQAEMSQLYSMLGRTKEGIAVGMKALETAKTNNITAKLPMIYTALASNYEAEKDYARAAEVYKQINSLKDSMYADANPRALAEMRTRYETEKQEWIIQQQQNKIARNNFILMGIAGAVLMLGLLAYSFYRRSHLKREAQMQAELRRQQELSAKAVIEAEEEERQRIARDLHDSIGQMMSAAKMNLSAFESDFASASNEQRQALDRIIRLVDDSCREVRHVSHNMMPNALLKNSLGSAIRDFVDKIDRKALDIHLYTEGLDERLDSNIETVFYRVVQECVNNVLKHADARSLDISVIRDSEGISATIEDNGRGFDTTDPEKFEGIGLKNIITRVEFLKGTVEFDSAPGRGTAISIHVPVPVALTNLKQ